MLAEEQHNDLEFREDLLAELEEAFGPMRSDVRLGPCGLEHKPNGDSLVYAAERALDEIADVARIKAEQARRKAHHEHLAEQRRRRAAFAAKHADELREQERRIGEGFFAFIEAQWRR